MGQKHMATAESLWSQPLTNTTPEPFPCAVTPTHPTNPTPRPAPIHALSIGCTDTSSACPIVSRSVMATSDTAEPSLPKVSAQGTIGLVVLQRM